MESNVHVLIFDLFGDFAHFRKYYSTSSPVTFSVVPPITVLGVIGAILGLEKRENQYLRILNEANTRVAIQLLHPVNKIRMGINLVNTKNNIWVPKQRKEGARTQIRYEFLKNVAYRLYVSMDNQTLLQKLIEMVKEHKSFYTICLGISELLADFRFWGEKEFQWREGVDEFVDVDSTVPLDFILRDGINLIGGKRYLKERMPMKMNHLREVLCYGDLLVEMQGLPLNVKLKGYWESDNTRIVLI